MLTIKDLFDAMQHSTVRTYTNYARVFGINYEDFLSRNHQFFDPRQEIKQELFDYFIKHKDFFHAFYKDWHSGRSMTQFAELTKQDIPKIMALFRNKKLFANYNYETTVTKYSRYNYVSTYQIIELLTGTQVVERPVSVKPLEFVQIPQDNKKSANTDDSKQMQIVGYEDIKTYITDELAPITNPKDMDDWGLDNPGGILLYGPPGCGKTMWANWIAEFLGFEFMEIPRSLFGSHFVDGAMNNLKELIEQLKSKRNLVVFFDEFDSVAPSRTSSQSSSGAESAKVVNTLLQEIPKLINRRIIIVAATNFIDSLDPAVIRPGRFDLKLPVFPPLPEERFELLYRAVVGDKALRPLALTSPLYAILKTSGLDSREAWQSHAESLKLFSNSQILDTAKIIKRKIKKFHKENEGSSGLPVPQELIESGIQEAKAKVTARDTHTLFQFLHECKELQLDIFNHRIHALENEITQMDKPEERTRIGFKK